MTDPNTDEALVAEAIARLIDPSSWRVFDGYLADVKRKYKGKDAGYDPAAFKDKKSIAIAERILALLATRGYVQSALLSQPPSGGWDEQEVARRSALKLNAWVGDTIRRAAERRDDAAVERVSKWLANIDREDADRDAGEEQYEPLAEFVTEDIRKLLALAKSAALNAPAPRESLSVEKEDE